VHNIFQLLTAEELFLIWA